jgi:hypothetical protein
MTPEEVQAANAEWDREIVQMIGDVIDQPSIPPCNYNDVVRDFRNAIRIALESDTLEAARKPLIQAFKNAGYEIPKGETS